MKNLKISGGKIIEGFCILPCIDVCWLTYLPKDNLTGNYKKAYDIRFAWLRWYITIGNIGELLNNFKNQ